MHMIYYEAGEGKRNGMGETCIDYEGKGGGHHA